MNNENFFEKDQLKHKALKNIFDIGQFLEEFNYFFNSSESEEEEEEKNN